MCTMQSTRFDENIASYKIIKTNFNVNAVKYTEDKKSISVGSFNGCVTLYNSKNTAQEMVLEDKETKQVDNVVTSITYPDKRGTALTCSYSGGLVKQWVIQTGTCNFTVKENRQSMGVLYHPNVNKFFTYGDDGRILLYDEETQKNELVYQSSESNNLDGHTTKIFSMCFNPAKPNEFISGGWDNVVYFWDARTPSATRYLSDVFIGGDGLTINKRGTDIVTCEFKKDNPMKLWDYRTGKLIKVINPDAVSSQLYCAKYLNDNTLVAGGSDANLLRIINMKNHTTLSCVKNLPSGVYSVDSTSLGKKGQFVNKFDELADLPKITFSAGEFIYELSKENVSLIYLLKVTVCFLFGEVLYEFKCTKGTV